MPPETFATRRRIAPSRRAVRLTRAVDDDDDDANGAARGASRGIARTRRARRRRRRSSLRARFGAEIHVVAVARACATPPRRRCDAARRATTPTTTTAATPKRARGAGEFRRFAYATLRATLLERGDGDGAVRAVFATCRQSREKSATAALRRMLGQDSAYAPVKLPARGALLMAASGGGSRADGDGDGETSARRRARREGRGVENFYTRCTRSTARSRSGTRTGCERACERVVRETRARSEDARSKSIAFAVVYNKRVDSTASVSEEDTDASDVAHGRAVMVPKIAKACERAFKDADAECEVSVNLKDPNVVVFAQVFAALPSGDEAKSYIVAVGAAARDDGVFEVKSRGIAPVSVSAVSPRRDAAPKWMLKKALARAAAPAPDDAHR